nr:GDP-mannose 4,6-dehydratase [uncultured Mucilaginibacter sp.]
MPQFWRNKRVLITGADGFIGSHLVEYLQSNGALLRALVLYNSFNNWGWLESVADRTNIEIIAGDIRDAGCCEKLTEGIDIVFHLASLISVPYSIQNPASFIDTNISGTFNMCSAAQKCNAKFIYISSSEVYGTAQYLPIDERHPLQAQSPYSASKISAEAIVYSFYRSYGLKATIARPFNTYGPRQSARAIIPAIIIQIASGSKEVKLGNLSPRRDLNYVADTCRGLALIAENDGLIGETINIGSGTDYSMTDVFALICKQMDADVQLLADEQRVRPAGAEVEHLLCNNSKIKQFTGFTPAYTFEEGLRQTINWLVVPGNMAGYKSKVYNV